MSDMTRKEAIKAFQDMKRGLYPFYPNEYFDMAIKALEQEPKFIAKSDGTIEQIKNCNDCLFKKEWEKIGKLLSVVLEKQTEQEPILDKIRAEIIELRSRQNVGVLECLDIIDKYKAESEEKP